jgi:hypothetical protein
VKYKGNEKEMERIEEATKRIHKCRIVDTG